MHPMKGRALARCVFAPGAADGPDGRLSLRGARVHDGISREGVARGAPLRRLRRTRGEKVHTCEGLRGVRACAGASGVPIAWGLRGAMWFAVKRLLLGMLLIAAGSGVLLLTDVRPPGADGRPRPRIAILQQASTPILDEGVRGMIDGLAEKGYPNGATADIKTFNAEGDIATANTIAREITDGDFDLVITSSTPSLQVVANANRAGRAMHVFGIVADPYVADVGLDRADPLKHPRHMVGLSTWMPITDVLRIAKQMDPGLKRIGLAW